MLDSQLERLRRRHLIVLALTLRLEALRLNQVGMFTLTGLTKGQVEYLQKEHHVYMPADGRICVAALHKEACAPLARAMKDAIEKVKDD